MTPANINRNVPTPLEHGADVLLHASDSEIGSYLPPKWIIDFQEKQKADQDALQQTLQAVNIAEILPQPATAMDVIQDSTQGVIENKVYWSQNQGFWTEDAENRRAA